jgi:hypothetical protein
MLLTILNATNALQTNQNLRYLMFSPIDSATQDSVAKAGLDWHVVNSWQGICDGI